MERLQEQVSLCPDPRLGRPHPGGALLSIRQDRRRQGPRGYRVLGGRRRLFYQPLPHRTGQGPHRGRTHHLLEVSGGEEGHHFGVQTLRRKPPHRRGRTAPSRAIGTGVTLIDLAAESKVFTF